MNSLVIGIFLLILPLAFAGGLLYFMASGKGTKPLDINNENENKEEQEGNDIKGKKQGK